MKNIYCVLCGKYRKFKNSTISYVIKKLALVLLIICNMFENEDGKTFKKEDSIVTLQILGLIKIILLL